ncbi:hypothetical protein M885DRAFT_504764 [Pelagophyceae sp. CCMP2097]|nr:hypothetical protein M885DRAFT_504764 [Pelagophyceae sp. CCMP2097]
MAEEVGEAEAAPTRATMAPTEAPGEMVLRLRRVSARFGTYDDARAVSMRVKLRCELDGAARDDVFAPTTSTFAVAEVGGASMVCAGAEAWVFSSRALRLDEETLEAIVRCVVVVDVELRYGDDAEAPFAALGSAALPLSGVVGAATGKATLEARVSAAAGIVEAHASLDASMAFETSIDEDTADFFAGSRVLFVDSAAMRHLPQNWAPAADAAADAPRPAFQLRLDNSKTASPLVYGFDLGEAHAVAVERAPAADGEDVPPTAYDVRWAATVAVLLPKATCDALMASKSPVLRLALGGAAADCLVLLDAAPLYAAETAGAVELEALVSAPFEAAPAPAADAGADAAPEEGERPPTLAARLAKCGTAVSLTCRLSAPFDRRPARKLPLYGDVVKVRSARAVALDALHAQGRDLQAELRRELDDMVTALATEMAKVVDKSSTGTVAVTAENEAQWLFKLNAGGVYHQFKERLKSCVQRLVRAKYGTDAAAADGAAAAAGALAGAPRQPAAATRGIEYSPHDRFVNEMYVELMRQANAVLNLRFRDAESHAEPPAHPGPFHVEHPRGSEPKAVAAMRECAAGFAFLCADDEANSSWDRVELRHEECLSALQENVQNAPLQDVDVCGASMAKAWREYGFAALRCAARRMCLPSLAEAPLRNALVLEPRHETAMVSYAALLIERGDFAAALAVLAADHGDVYAILLAGLTHHLEGDAAKARAEIERAARLDAPDCGLRARVCVLLDLAEWLVLRGLQRGAKAALQMARAAEARAQRHARLLGQAAAIAAPARFREQSLRIEARLLFVAGEVALAEVAAKRSCAAAPRHPDAWTALGDVLAASGDVKQATAAYARALALFGADVAMPSAPLWLSVAVGDASLALGDADLAAQVYLGACRAHASAAAWRGAGRALLARGDYADAERALGEANVRDKRDAATWAYLALANLGQYTLGDSARIDEAAAAVAVAERLDLVDAQLLCEVALEFTKVDRDAVSARLLRRAVAAAPTHKAARQPRRLLARALAKQCALVDAAAEYAALLEDAADAADAESLRIELAPILAKLGKSLSQEL